MGCRHNQPPSHVGMAPSANNSGPLRRLYNDPVKSGPVNWQSGTIKLPPQSTLPSLPSGQTVNAYFGGWGGSPKNTAVDAGLFYNGGGNPPGWTLFISTKPSEISSADPNYQAAQGGNGFLTYPKEFVTVGGMSKVYIYRVADDQPVDMTYWSSDNQLNIRISAIWIRWSYPASKITDPVPPLAQLTKDNLGLMTRNLSLKLVNGSGWTLAGTDQNLKINITIGQASPTDVVGTQVVPDIQLSSLKIGKGSATGSPIGTPKSWDTTILTRSTLTKPSRFDCTFPPDVVTTTSSTASSETVSIKLRRLGDLKVDTPNPPLTAVTGTTVTGTVRLSNVGQDNSVVTYDFTPLGSTTVVKGSLDKGQFIDKTIQATCPQQQGVQNLIQKVTYTDGTALNQGTNPNLPISSTNPPDPNNGNRKTLTRNVPITVNCTQAGHRITMSPTTTQTFTLKTGKTKDVTINVGASGVAQAGDPAAYGFNAYPTTTSTPYFSSGQGWTQNWITVTAGSPGTVALGAQQPVTVHLACPARPNTAGQPATATLALSLTEDPSLTDVNQVVPFELNCVGPFLETTAKKNFNNVYRFDGYSDAPREGSFDVKNTGNEALTYQAVYSSNKTSWITFLENASGTVPAGGSLTIRYRYACSVLSTFTYSENYEVGRTSTFGFTSNSTARGQFAVNLDPMLETCAHVWVRGAQLAANTCPRDGSGNLVSCAPRTGFSQPDPGNLRQYQDATVMAVVLETGAQPDLVSLTPPDTNWKLVTSQVTSNGRTFVYWKYPDYLGLNFSPPRLWQVTDNRASPANGRWGATWVYGVYAYIDNRSAGTPQENTNPPVLPLTAVLPRPSLQGSLSGGLDSACLSSDPTVFCQAQPFGNPVINKLAYAHRMLAPSAITPPPIPTNLTNSSVGTSGWYVVTSPWDSELGIGGGTNGASQRLGLNAPAQPLAWPPDDGARQVVSSQR
jgi:hypothetical protein